MMKVTCVTCAEKMRKNNSREHNKKLSKNILVHSPLTIAKHFVISYLFLFGVKNSDLEIDRSLKIKIKKPALYVLLASVHQGKTSSYKC